MAMPSEKEREEPMPKVRKSKRTSMLDFIMMMSDQENKPLTREEFTRIRRHGTPEEISEAVERMMAQGGYDCLG